MKTKSVFLILGWLLICGTNGVGAAEPFSAPARFDFGAGGSSVYVDVTVKGPFGIKIPVSITPNPVPLNGFMTIDSLNEVTGSFEGKLENLRGETDIKVIGLFSVSVKVVLNGAVAGVFQWSQDRVTFFSTGVSAEAEVSGDTQHIPFVEFVLDGSYGGDQLSVQHQGSFSGSYAGQSYDLDLGVDFQAALEPLAGPAEAYAGSWTGVWISDSTSASTPLHLMFCPSGTTVSGEGYVDPDGSGWIRAAVSGAVSGDTIDFTMGYEHQGAQYSLHFSDGVLAQGSIVGMVEAVVQGAVQDQGSFVLSRVFDAARETNGVWKGGGGNWFIQKYTHGGALVIFSVDLSSFTVYGIDSASGLSWTSGPDLGDERYLLDIEFTSSSQATAVVTDTLSQSQETHSLTKFAGAPLTDVFIMNDGVYKGAEGTWFVQRYDHCGALVIFTLDMSSYRVYGVDSALGGTWFSNPDMNSGSYAVDLTFPSLTEANVILHDLVGSTSIPYTLSLFAGAE